MSQFKIEYSQDKHIYALPKDDVEQIKSKVNKDNFATEGAKYLHYAILYGQISIVKFLIENGVSVAMINQAGKTPLHLAMKYEQINVARYLLEKGANINAANTINGDTPLHIAVETGNLNLVTFLIENKANVEIKNKRGQTPLHTAALVKSPELVDFLIWKANANETVLDNENRTALDIAKAFLHEDLILKFKEERKKYLATNQLRRLIPTIKSEQNFEAIDQLVKDGADLNCPIKTSLFNAIKSNNIPLAKYLTMLGADVNAIGVQGFPETFPINMAASKGDLELFRYLLSMGAIFEIDAGSTLFCAVKGKNIEIIEILLDAKVPVDNRFQFGSLEEVDMTPLHMAVKNGRIDIVELLINRKANLKYQDKNGNTLLHLAVLEGDLDMVTYLVSKNVDLTQTNNNHETPLYLAEKNNKSSIVEYLVQHDKSLLNHSTKNGNTPLVKIENIELSNFSLEQDLIVNTKNKEEATSSNALITKENVNQINEKGKTPLQQAIKVKNLKLVRDLVAMGADINQKNKKGQTSIEQAVNKNALEILAFLIENGADINAALSLAIDTNNLKTSIYLLEKGANPNQKVGENTIFQKAILQDNKNMIEKLVEYGGCFNKLDVNQIIFHHIARDNLDMLKFLVNKGIKFDKQNLPELRSVPLLKYLLTIQKVNLDQRDWLGKTLLHQAACYNESEFTEILIDHGVDLHGKDNEGNTPLHLAAKSFWPNAAYIVAILAENGANLNAQNNNGDTPLHLASIYNIYAVKELLLQGANPNAVNKQNNTPLHLAVKEQNLKIVEQLIEQGADIYVKNQENNTHLDLDRKITKYLEKQGMFGQKDLESTKPKAIQCSEKTLPRGVVE